MSLLEPLEANKAARSVPAQLASNWIEVFAIPTASAIMETQPVAVALLLAVPHVFGAGSMYPDAASITLLLLFLHWWSMGTRYVFERRGATASTFTLYDTLGILLALLALAVTHLDAITDPTFSFIALALIGWSWKRGADRARAGLNEEQLINAFKNGFTVLLIALGFALLALFAAAPELADVLLRNLPIFFLSGMITLSFTRIGIIRQEQARHAVGGRHEKMGAWLLTLTITWVALVVVSIALEALPLQIITNLLSPLWYALNVLASIIAYVLDLIVTVTAGFIALLIGLLVLLLHLQRRNPRAPVLHPAQVLHITQDSGATLLVLRLFIVALFIIITIVITRFLQKRHQAGADDALDEEEEVREGLDINQVLRARREERGPRQQAFTPAALEQNSMRARYRAFLAAMANKGEDLARHPAETPAEYQQRLLVVAREVPTAGDATAPADPEILAALTQAYSRERYGAKQTDSEQQNFLRQWVPHLIQRFNAHLTSRPEKSKSKRMTTTQKTIQSRWGED
ncbi:MAG: hypothetical protein PVS3B1_20390 [Ktedonobacteraceae bacterium]